MSELSPLTTIAGQWASLGDLTGRQMDKYKLKYPNTVNQGNL